MISKSPAVGCIAASADFQRVQTAFTHPMALQGFRSSVLRITCGRYAGCIVSRERYGTCDQVLGGVNVQRNASGQRINRLLQFEARALLQDVFCGERTCAHAIESFYQ